MTLRKLDDLDFAIHTIDEAIKDLTRRKESLQSLRPVDEPGATKKKTKLTPPWVRRGEKRSV